MTRTQTSARRRLLKAALDLFTSQGFNSTTTRQIADLAQVNEATLFRNFGSKHDLLLAVIEESGVLAQLQDSLQAAVQQKGSLAAVVRQYAHDGLVILEPVAELLRALVGEAGHYSVENRRMFGQRLAQMTRELAGSLNLFLAHHQMELRIPLEKWVSLLNNLLLGYLFTELTREEDEVWETRDDFLNHLVIVCLHGTVAKLMDPATPPAAQDLDPDIPKLINPSEINPSEINPSEINLSEIDLSETDPVKALDWLEYRHPATQVGDLPAELVSYLLQRAKKQGLQTYALVYLLFGAGLLPEEVVGLDRVDHFCSQHQHLVQINRGMVRQVPVNQWIMGKRYGSYLNNPLSQWLKKRNDDKSPLFVTEQGERLSEAELLIRWQTVTATVLTPDVVPPRLEQTRQTWCVEMLSKGMSPEDLSILSGWSPEQLRPYVQRAREKAALERAIQLDQPSSRSAI